MNHFRDLDFIHILTPNNLEEGADLCVSLANQLILTEDFLSGFLLLDKFVQYVLKSLTALGPTEMQETPGVQLLKGLIAEEFSAARI